MLDKSISADENTKANVAVNYKGRGSEQETELREGGIGIEHALCGSVRISRRDTLDENRGLVEIEGEARVLLECLMSESTSRAMDSLALMPSSAYATAHASWLCLLRVRPHK